MLRPRAHSIILPIVLIFLRRTFRIHSPIVAREQLLVGVLIGSIPLVVFIVKSLVGVLIIEAALYTPPKMTSTVLIIAVTRIAVVLVNANASK